MQNLAVANVDATSITIKWDAPTSFNGQPLSYGVELTDTDTATTVFVFTALPNYTFSSLVAFRNYSIGVFARSSGGNGSTVTIVQQTSASGTILKCFGNFGKFKPTQFNYKLHSNCR